MLPRARRRWAVALLPLLVLLLSGWSAPGGWFCADGVKCEPLLSAGCCCEENEAQFDRVGAAGAESALESTACGCYFDNPEIDASPASRALPDGFTPALVTASYQLPADALETGPRKIPPSLRGPPGDPLQTRSGRGPPVA